MSLLEILTGATLLVLIWYTVETYRLRKAAQAQVESGMMPMVVFQFCRVKQETHNGFQWENRPVVRNLGAGPAFNVSIRPVPVGDKAAEFEFPRMLAPAEEQFVAICGLRDKEAFDGGRVRTTRPFLTALQSCKDRTSTRGCITYTSAIGKTFATMFTILHDSSEVDAAVFFEGMKEI
jgi:hypothetical protein